MSGGQNYLLPAMDMAKAGGPLSVVKVFAQIWHPKSTPYYFSFLTILSVIHIINRYPSGMSCLQENLMNKIFWALFWDLLGICFQKIALRKTEKQPSF